MTHLLDPELLATALESIPHGVLIANRNGEILWANCQVSALMGLPVDKITGQALGQFMPAAAPGRDETSCRRADGESFSVARTITGIRDGNLLITLDEIPQQNRQLQEHYRLISENTVDVIFLWSLTENRCVFVTPSVSPLRGFTPQEVLGQSLEEAMSPDSYRIVIRLLAEWVPAVEAGDESARVRVNELEFRCKDGSVVATETITKFISDELGKVRLVLGVSRDINERKLVQQAIREAEEKYRGIFDGALEGIYRTSLHGRPLAANPAIAKMLGYDSPEDVRNSIANVGTELWVDADERARFIDLLQTHGTVRNFECRQRRKDGSIIWVSLNSRRVTDSGGEPFNEGFMEDITERKRMEDALRQSEDKFSRAFLSSPAAVTILDVADEGRFLDANEAFETDSGYPRHEIIGRTITELDIFENPRQGLELLGRLAREGRLRGQECRYRNREGKVRIALLSAELINLDGRNCAIVTTLDITERKRAEERIGILATAIEQAGEQILITGLDGNIEYCNPAFEKISGYSKEEVLGRNTRLLKSGKQNEEFYRSMWATIRSGSVWFGQFTNRRKNGLLYEEEATISPIRDDSGRIKGYVAVKRDVSERIQLENQFRQAQKLESIGRLAGGVAHDFNNLLTVINGYSDMLATKLKPYDPLWPYVEEIRKAGERGAGLTRQLLTFSRKQVIEVRTLDLNAIVRDAERMLHRVIGEDIELLTILDSAPGMVRGDLDQIHQVIMNLVVNARDAMPDGGQLVIETRHTEVDETAAGTYPDAAPGSYVMLLIKDNGSGMDEKTQEHMFEPFFTTKEAGKGTGLGLSTVYGIVRQNGGWIQLVSHVGVGTAFQIYLPSVEASPLAPPQEPVFAHSRNAGQTILLVEDHAEVRKLIFAVLTQRGYRVLEACDGGEAFMLASEYADEIHLLLSDVVMPGMNGKELSERLRSVRPNIKILFSSGYTADVVANRGVLEHHVALLQKPFTADELARKVSEVLSG
jgi:two-component system cell cycle sensor histidine kinase/response regulator CckA